VRVLALTATSALLIGMTIGTTWAATLGGTATAHLHLVPPIEGSTLYEEGPVTGALSGTVKARLQTGAIFSGQFAIRTRNGTISGRGSANPHGSGRYQSFSGSFLATGGTDRYAHIHGHANLYGVIDRRTDAVTIQTVGNGKLIY
jgi:hypothetical protein